MKLLERSRCKRNISVAVIFTVLALPLPLFSSVNAVSIEYLCLTARGESMYPTIGDGDSVTVQLCFNGSLINVGDIIVYSTIATGMNPDCMWIGHRVIEKYRKDGNWWFKTKGDNCPEPDPWEVPEYWLLGLVVSIDHSERSYVPVDTSPQEDSDSTYSKPSFLEGPQTLLLIIGIFFLGAAMAVFKNLRRRKEKSALTQISDQSTRHHPEYHRELARQRGIPTIQRLPRRGQLSVRQRITDEDGKTLVRTWRNSILGLVKLSDKNLTDAKRQLENKRHELAVIAASASVENIARALIHCYGGKPEPGLGQEEALKILSGRFKGEEKVEFERALFAVARISHNRIALRYISKHKVQIRLLDEAKVKEILGSASRIVHLFKRILIDHFAAEIPELQYEVCPKCCSPNIWVWNFGQFIVNYQCSTCGCKWTGPREYFKP